MKRPLTSEHAYFIKIIVFLKGKMQTRRPQTKYSANSRRRPIPKQCCQRFYPTHTRSTYKILTMNAVFP